MEGYENSLNVIFTIDVESSRGNVPYLIEGDLSKFGIHNNCGINFIMDTFAAYNANVVCFVNIFEESLYENDYMPSLLRRIDRRGNEVALHAHTPPEGGQIPFYSKCIANCSLEEQKRIFKYGRDYIFKAIGKNPISYRSGAYWTNDYIFKALQENGFKVDSSVYYMHKNNHFEKYKNKQNQVFEVDGIIEFPIVVVWNGEGWRKLDLDSLTEDELVSSFEIMRKSDSYHTVQCMFHSFSFIDNKGNGESVPILDLNSEKTNHFTIYGEDKRKKEKLERILSFLCSSPGYRVLTFEQLLKQQVDFSHASEDGLLYLKNSNMAFTHDDIDVLYNGSDLFLKNNFKTHGMQYAWHISSVHGEAEEYQTDYQPAPMSRIKLNENANGTYNIRSYMKGEDGKRVGGTFFRAIVSEGSVLSVERI